MGKIEPDIMMVAKGMGGGFPLGAVLAKENAASGMTAGPWINLWGNPLGCSIGLKVMILFLTQIFYMMLIVKQNFFMMGYWSF